MFAVAFDLIVADTERNHPKGVSQAYTDIANELTKFGFSRVQGSLYVSNDENLANLFAAMQGLKTLPWFGSCVRDIRAFRVEQWSNFTNVFRP